MNSSDNEQSVPRRARTRQKLIESARQAIWEKGFHRTTIDEIAAKAGLTKGAVYDNFRSKDELILAVVMTFPDTFELPRDRSGSVKARLRRLAEAVLANQEATRAMVSGQAEFLLYALTHEEIRTRMAELMAAQVAETEAWAREMFKPAELSLAPRQFALMIETLKPSLMYTRALSASYMAKDDVIAMFESLAGAAPD